MLQSSGIERGPRKRIVVCCDGTWMNSGDGYDGKTHTLLPSSNVTRFARALSTKGDPFRGEDDIPQLVYYQAGVGSGGSLWDKISGGVAGAGLDEHIREAYAFIAQNWYPGDEIFLLGFSRGAFTARSIAGLISTIGILTKCGMAHFYRIFKDYENMNDEKYQNPVKDSETDMLNKCLPLSNPAKRAEYIRMLTEHKTSTGERDPLTAFTDDEPMITAIGVWDTVGSLGIPGTWLQERLFDNVQRQELRFGDTNLASRVKYAFQALALEEARYSFKPAVWARPADQNLSTKLKQVWFPGVHGSIGGGDASTELSDISLAWMMDQMSPWLYFDEKYVGFLLSGLLYNPRPDDSKVKYRPWSCGKIDTSGQAWYARIGYWLAGDHFVRTPGQYVKINKDTGKPEISPKTKAPMPLEDTQERVHASVRIRLIRNGKGVDDRGNYSAEALTPHTIYFGGNARHGWKVEKIGKTADEETIYHLQKDFLKDDKDPKSKFNDPKAQFLWRSLSPTIDDGFPKIMLEEPLDENMRYQSMLCRIDPNYRNLTEMIDTELPKAFAAETGSSGADLVSKVKRVFGH